MATHNVGPTDANPSISDGDTVIYGSGEHTVVRSIDTTGFTIGIDIQLHPNAKIHAFETLTGWVVHSGNVWKKTSWSRSPINTGGTSQSGYNAQKSIDLLTQSDSASDTFNWFVHRDSLVNVTQDGEWYLDEDAGGAGVHDIYMYSSGGDPDSAFDRVVVSNAEKHFVHGTGDNTTIRVQPNTGYDYYTRRPQIRGYAPNAQEGCIDIEQGVSNALLDGIDVIYNHGVGVLFRGDDGIMRGVQSIYNGQMGSGGSGTTSAPATNNLVEHAEFSYNNQAKFSHGWEAGGTKWVRHKDMALRYCRAVGNEGPGLWWDIDNYNVFGYRNIAIENTAVGIFYEISSHGYFTHNWCVDNGQDTGASFAWGAQLLIASSPDCEVAYNHLAVSITTGSGKPDCMGDTQQNRGTFQINDGSTLFGTDRKALRTRIHHNTFLLGVDSTDQFLIGLHADFDDAAFNTASNWRVDYNEYWKITAETNTIYQWDSTSSANNLTEFQTESGFETNGTENNESSTSTFPAGWDSDPGWFDLAGKTRRDKAYEDRLQEMPALVRAYTMDDVSGNIADDSEYGADVVNNGADYGATGIGDGKDGLDFVAANSDFINAWTAGLEAGDLNGDQFTFLLWPRPDAASWTNATQQHFIRWGSGGVAGQIFGLYRQSTTNNQLQMIMRHNGDNFSVSSTYSFTTPTPLIWRMDYVGQLNQMYVDTTVELSDTSPTEIGWANDPDFASDHLFLGAANTTADYMDGVLAYFYVFNGALPDVLLDELRQFNDFPVVTDPGNQSDPEDSPISTLSISATDKNPADTLTYNAYNLPAGLSINSGTGDITGAPTTPGTYPVEVEVVDDGTPNRAQSVYFDWEITAVAPGGPAQASERDVFSVVESAFARDVRVGPTDG